MSGVQGPNFAVGKLSKHRGEVVERTVGFLWGFT